MNPTKQEIEKLIEQAKKQGPGIYFLEVLTETINLCSKELSMFFNPEAAHEN